MRRVTIALLFLVCPSGADDGEERAFLGLQRRLAEADPAQVLAEAERFRARFPDSGFLPAVLVAEMRAYEAMRAFLAAKAVALEILGRFPDSVAARSVLASFASVDDCSSAIQTVVETWLFDRDPAHLQSLRRLVPAALEARPDLEGDEHFVLHALSLVRDDPAMTARLEKALRGLDDEAKTLTGVIREAGKDPAAACTRLQADDGAGASCAAILVAAGALDGAESAEARLVRARADLRYRARTDPGPLLDPAPESAEHATLAVLALASTGRRDEARQMAARERKRFATDARAAALAEIENFLSGPPPDVPALVDKVLEPALRRLFRGAERWDLVVHLSGEGRDVEAHVFLDFAREDWRILAKSKGMSVAMFHGTGRKVRFWLGEPRIYEMPLGDLLPAVRLDLAQAANGALAVDFKSEALPWTEMGKANAALRRNPLLAAPEGIERLVTRSPRVTLLTRVDMRIDDADVTHVAWGWPAIDGPQFTTLEARFKGDWLIQLRSGDTQVKLRYGGSEDVPELVLPWPEHPVSAYEEELPAGQLLQILGRLVQKLEGGQGAGK